MFIGRESELQFLESKYKAEGGQHPAKYPDERLSAV